MPCRGGSSRTVCGLIALAVSGGLDSAEAQSSSTRPPTAGVPAAPGAPTQEAEAVRIVIEMRIGDLTSVTVPAYRVGEEPLVPLSSLLRLAEVNHTLHAHGTLEAVMHPGNVPLVITATHDLMSYGGRRTTIPRELKIFRGGDLYVSAHAFGELLGLSFVVDWPELTVTITDPRSLPIARRLAREAARSRLLGRSEGPTGPALSYPLHRPPLDGLVLDYTVSAPGADLRASNYSFAAGMNAFGGSLEGAAAGTVVASGQAVRYTGSWTGVWPAASWVKQVRLGDAVSTGQAPRLMRGGTVTNSPFIRPTRFGIDAFRGVLAPNWEVEAYRGDQLIAFDSTDLIGRYAIPIPTEYGENPLEFIAYGPFGEVQHFDRMYRVAGELVPARQFEYGLSAGQCVATSCAGTANVDFRYGISSRWTVRAGYDGFQRDTLAALSHPYAGVTGSLTDAVGIQLDGVAGASVRGLIRYEPSTRMRLATEYTHFDHTDSLPVLTPAGWRARWLVSALVRPRGLTSSAYAEGDAAYVETVNGMMLRARLIASGQWRGARFSPYARFERDAFRILPTRSRSFFGVNSWIPPRGGWRLLGRAWVRAAVEVEQSAGLSQASIAITRQFVRGVRIEAGGRWTRTSTVATLLTAIDLAAVRSYTTMVVPKNGAPTAGEYLQGSIVVNTAAKEIALAAGPSLQRSGVAGRVFLDHNSNGLLDVGEPALPNVTVRVGAAAATSDSKGRFEVWNVTPYEPAGVSVDSMSLSSPLWMPRYATMTVVPGPNRFVLVDVPIVPGGAVEGRVVLETPDGRQGVGTARVTLIERQSGARRTLVTFLDGEFIAIGVRPGQYDVMVDDQLLTQLQATASPTRFTLKAAAEGASVTGVEVLLRRGSSGR